MKCASINLFARIGFNAFETALARLQYCVNFQHAQTRILNANLSQSAKPQWGSSRLELSSQVTTRDVITTGRDQNENS